MRVTVTNVQLAVTQHLTQSQAAMLDDNTIVKVFMVLQSLESLPGFQMAEVLTIAQKAAQNQVIQDERSR